MFKSTIEIKAHIIVVLGDEPTPRVANRNQRIDFLAQAVADNLKADTLPCFDINGKSGDGRLADLSPQGKRQLHFSRPPTRSRRGPHGQAAVQAKMNIDTSL